MADAPDAAPIGVEQLRLAAALAHSAPDVDVELVGAGRRWIVSYRRPCATVDPCGFRQLVLATARGCRVGLLPVTTVRFTFGLLDIGGGVYDASGLEGPMRRIATLLPGSAVEALLRDIPDGGAAVEAHLCPDEELGTTVVTLSAPHATRGVGLDSVAQAVSASCMAMEVMAGLGQPSI